MSGKMIRCGDDNRGSKVAQERLRVNCRLVAPKVQTIGRPYSEKMYRFGPLPIMILDTMQRNKVTCVVLIMIALFAHAAGGRAQTGSGDKAHASQQDTARLRIEVSGGDANKPVADASVYVKFPQERKIRKNKTIELNLKTNQEGVARSPEIPQGKTLIQVVAPGWKTYGEWHDVNQSEQTIEIHLVRPTAL